MKFKLNIFSCVKKTFILDIINKNPIKLNIWENLDKTWIIFIKK